MDEDGRQTGSQGNSGAQDPGGGDLPPLPSSLIPRWLAAVVLVALLASGVWTTWIILSQ